MAPLSSRPNLSRCSSGPRRRWLVLAALALLVPSVARADDWPAIGLQAAHGRASAERSGAAFSDGRWSFSPAGDAGALSSPVVADGVVISARLDGGVSALQAHTGRPIWERSLHAAVQGTPAIARGRIFIPTLGTTVVALALADGEPLWSTKLGALNVSSPTVVDGDIIVGAGLPQQLVARLDGTTGAIIWRTPPGMEQFSNTPPAVADGLVVVGTNAGHYYAFDASTGIPRWDYRGDGIVNLAAPLITGGRVIMAGGGESHRVHAVNARTGAAISGWPITLPTPDPDLPGTVTDRRRAISSFAATGNVLLLETRLDDALDTDADGRADHHLAREWAMALDAASGAVVWQQQTARVVFDDANAVPGFVVCPTPALFGTVADGRALAAFASSLVGNVSILEAATGADDRHVQTAGRALASPVLANGRLITVAENGTVEAMLSSVNHPPDAPLLAPTPAPLDAAAALLRWSAAQDADGEQATYEVRIDGDGEVLQTFAQRMFPPPGTTSVTPAALLPGITYTVAVRARDPEGAYSPWSDPQPFTVVASGSVTVDGKSAASLRDAVASALPGSVISLGAGIFPLTQTLVVPPGARIAGAGAGRTVLEGSGSMVGVTFGAGGGGGLDRVTVTGASTCVSVPAGADVALTHLVIHGCTTAGVSVAADGKAAIANATIIGNGTGVLSAGRATVKNSLLADNQVGLSAATAEALSSSYDDLFGNAADRQGGTAAAGELAVPVIFANASSHDYRLIAPQPTTDLGDPADSAGDEPTPNGERINLGAFGGTADAERSPASLGASSPPSSPVPTVIPPGDTGHPGAEGCRVAGGSPRPLSLGLLLAATLLVGRRRRRR